MIFKRSKKIVPLPGQERRYAEPPPLPPLAVQAANLAKAGVAVSGNVIARRPAFLAEDETARLVETHCKGHGSGVICESFRFSDGKCAACGCPVYGRASVNGLGCPEKKF